MNHAVTATFLATSLEDADRLCASLSEIMRECSRGNACVMPSAVVERVFAVCCPCSCTSVAAAVLMYAPFPSSPLFHRCATMTAFP